MKKLRLSELPLSFRNLADNQKLEFLKVYTLLEKEDIEVRLTSADIAAKSLIPTSSKKALARMSAYIMVSKSDETTQGEDMNPLPVIKQLDGEQMIAIEPLYTTPDTADAHDDGMTEGEIRKMVDNINKNITKIKGNIQHTMNTDGFHFVKAWVNETECTLGDQVVPEGLPIIKVQFTDPKLWELRKRNVLKGLSIGALGTRTDNLNYKEE